MAERQVIENNCSHLKLYNFWGVAGDIIITYNYQYSHQNLTSKWYKWQSTLQASEKWKSINYLWGRGQLMFVISTALLAHVNEVTKTHEWIEYTCKSCWSAACNLLPVTSINYRASQNNASSLTMYTNI